METPLVSPYEGVVRKVHVAEGDRVAGGALRRGAGGVRVRGSTTPAPSSSAAGPLLLADEAAATT